MAGMEGLRPRNKEAALDDRGGQSRVQPAEDEIATETEIVGRQLGLQVEGIAQFIRKSMYKNFPYKERHYKSPPEFGLRVLGYRGGEDVGDHFDITSVGDPIQGIVGGKTYGNNETEITTNIAYPGLTDPSVPPDPGMSRLVSEAFGFLPSARVDLNWHFDEPTLQGAVEYAKARPNWKNEYGHLFKTSYVFDKEGHFVKISTFPARIPDDRPALFGTTNINGVVHKDVQSPISAWDLSIVPSAVRMVDSKIRELVRMPRYN